jgi:hypothetical protein
MEESHRIIKRRINLLLPEDENSQLGATADSAVMKGEDNMFYVRRKREKFKSEPNLQGK